MRAFTSTDLSQPQILWSRREDAGVKVETLEDRTLFSGAIMTAGQSGVTFESTYRPPSVYEMPLTLTAAPAKKSAAPAPAASSAGAAAAPANRPTVTLLPSDDTGVLTGTYITAPLGAGLHPMQAAVSARGTNALNRYDTQSFAGRPPAARKATLPHSPQRRVLLIEDDPTARLALTALLKRRGWAVSSAATLAAGMSQLSEHPDDVIVDLMLPDGDGEKIVQEVRKNHLGSKVIVMTGVSDPARLIRLNNLHPETVLSKPIDLAALLRAM